MTSLTDLYQFYCRRAGCKANSKLCSHLDEVYESNGGTREISKIDISTNYVGPKGVVPVCQLVKNLYSVEEIDMRHNSIQHENCEEVVLALSAHPNLRRVNLSFNKLHDSSTPLIEHLVKATPTLIECRLEGNDFSPQHLARVEEALNINRATQEAAAAAEAAEGQEAAARVNEQRKNKYVPYRSSASGVLTKETSGGHFHFASWRKNPQFGLYLTRAAATTITLKVQDPQPTKSLGFVVLRGKSLLKAVDFEPEDIIAESTFDDTTTKVHINLEASDREKSNPPYIIVPFAFSPLRTAEFQITAEVDPMVDGCIVTLESIEAQREWCETEIAGEWSQDNSAGDMSFPSWRRNDYYRFRYSGPVSRGTANLFFLLSKANDSDDNDEKEIGFYILRPDNKGRPPIRVTPDTVIATVPHQRSTSVKLHMEIACASIDFFVVPTTKYPDQLGTFKLRCYSTCHLEHHPSLHPHDWSHRQVNGEWDDQRDGGGRVDNPTTWVHNPSYELRVEPTPDNRTVDLHIVLERGTYFQDEVFARYGNADPVGARKYKEVATEEVGIIVTTTEGELPLVASCLQWSRERTNELYINELPAGTYYIVPLSRRAGHRDTYTMSIKASEVVGVSFEIPLARRLREKQLQRYAEENDARKKDTVTSGDGLTWRGSQIQPASPTQGAIVPQGGAENAGLHPYDEDWDKATKIRDSITESYMTNGTLYIDRDFPRAPSSLWLDPAKQPTVSNANVVAWLRPNEVRLATGSTNGTGVLPPSFAEQPQNLECEVDGGFTTQWLHGAVSLVSTRPDLLAKVIACHFPEYGFAQFRFFKNGRWQTITIDDHLPVDPLNELVFSKAITPVNDVFLPLVEKAYAKLNRCYEALHTGPEEIPAALMALTGGMVDTHELQTEQGREWSIKSIWKTLKVCREKNKLIGLSLNRGTQQADDKQYTGLHLDCMYAVTDSRDVEGKKLIKLRNYWGNSKPWKGKWTGASDSWTPTLKKAVDYVEERNVIWMSIDEVKYYFSHLYEVTLPLATAWTTTGFAANKASGDLQSPTWVNNPQFALNIKAEGTTRVRIGLHQPDARMTLTRAADAVPEYPAELGFVVIRTDDDSRRLMSITDRELPTSSVIAATRDIFLDIEASSDHKYIIMPFTVTPNKASNAFLSVWCADAVPLNIKLIESDRNVSVNGEWRGPTAGGPRTFGSWRNNPQFLLYPSESTQLTIVLRQRAPEPDDPSDPATTKGYSTAAHIGFCVMKARDIRRVLNPDPADIVLEVPHDNDHAVVGNVRVEGVRERQGMPYIIIPSTNNSHVDTGFTLEVISNKRVQLKPVDPEYDWKRVDLEGQWNYIEGTTGGSMHFSSWRNNPQYTIHFPTEKSGSVLAVLTKRDLHDATTSLGMTFMKCDTWGKGKMRKLLCPAMDILGKAASDESARSCELRIDYQVRSEPILLMVNTVMPLTEMGYDLSLYCSSDIQVSPVVEWKNGAVEGTWQPGITAGGARENNRSWINNPFYALNITRPTRVVVVALQYPRGPEKPVVRRVGKNRAYLPPPIVNEKSKVSFGFDVCHFDSLNTNIHSTRHTYEGEVTCMLELPPCTTTPYLIVPHTYDPEQEADFKLLVFADEPFDVYHHEKARRFY